MKLLVKKIVRPLELAQYASELSGQTVQVWLNPTREMLKDRDQIFMDFAERQDAVEKAAEAERAELLKQFTDFMTNEFIDRNDEWFARLWSQHDDTSTHWTVAELKALNDQDPALYKWMKERSMSMFQEFRSAEKKG